MNYQNAADRRLSLPAAKVRAANVRAVDVRTLPGPAVTGRPELPARPIMPTRKALSRTEWVWRARAYICQPMATLWIWAAKLPVQRDPPKKR